MAPPPQKLEILSGWNAVASYLGRGIRTVQRYEREMGLPIHRPAGKSLAEVVAIKTELDEWVTAPRSRTDSMAKRRALKNQTNKLRANFLRVDCDIALTFASIALEKGDSERRRRTAEAARKAYDTITRLWEDIDLGEAERHKLEGKLGRLKSQLEKLGQRF